MLWAPAVTAVLVVEVWVVDWVVGGLVKAAVGMGALGTGLVGAAVDDIAPVKENVSNRGVLERDNW